MITQVQILPSICQLKRQGLVGPIQICALNSTPLKTLAEDAILKEAFPGQTFEAHPPLDTLPDKMFPEIFKEIITKLPRQSIVVIAVPDKVHNSVIKVALEHDQHICCVKPLVLKYEQSLEIEKLAYEKGLVIGVEFHKRLDDRALIARRQYRQGLEDGLVSLAVCQAAIDSWKTHQRMNTRTLKLTKPVSGCLKQKYCHT